jgi:hypothetical protein
MRIIIETDEREPGKTSAIVPTGPDSIETMHGGAPSEDLVQTITGNLPMPAEGSAAPGGLDGGTPPEWLMDAIQRGGQTRAETERLSGDINAGTAPSSED